MAYDNNLIEDRNKKAILATIIENGKDKVIQVREKSLEKYKYSKEEYQQKSDELAWIKSLDENKIQRRISRIRFLKQEKKRNVLKNSTFLNTCYTTILTI